MRPNCILAIECSSRHASIALSRGGETTSVAIDSQIGASAALIPAIQDVLAQRAAAPRDVDVLAYSHGPGSFTGLRIAATVARMFALVHDTRIVAVPTLEVIAMNSLRIPDCPPHVGVMLDAKRGQVFAAAFRILHRAERDPMLELLNRGPALHVPSAWLDSLPRPLGVIGEGIEKHAEVCAAAEVALLGREHAIPLAENVIRIGERMAAAGQFCPPDRITPLYIRPPECEEVYQVRREAAIAKRAGESEKRP